MNKNEFEGKKILVTGAAGSIGSEIVRQLMRFNPLAIRALDSNETGLFELEQELKNDNKVVAYFIGDVRDKERLNRAMENVDIVFHAAALKHVHLCEYNPFEAIKTNVIGTQNVIDACLNNNVERMVFISTDKAVNPHNVMGASKLLSERLTIAANSYRGLHPTIFSCVRFGNVLGSRGSVIPIFIDQIKKGGPVTVTDREMTRFIMSIPTSVKLILKAISLAKGGEIFVLRMPALKISDLAQAAIKEFAPRLNQKPEKISIEMIGKRPGEKMDEELFTEHESRRAKLLADDIIAIYPESAGEVTKPLNKAMTSRNMPQLNEHEIMAILREIRV